MQCLFDLLGLPWEPEQMEPLAAPERWGLEPQSPVEPALPEAPSRLGAPGAEPVWW